MKEIISGWFEYREDDGRWDNAFAIVDDDGMAFSLDEIKKKFHGRGVTVTIEINPELDVRPCYFAGRNLPKKD